MLSYVAMIKDKIIALLQAALKKNGLDARDINLEHPTNPAHGDYSTNVAFASAKQLKKQPLELAQQIKDSVPQDELVEKVTVEKPGFINFFLSGKALLQELKNINENVKNKSKAEKTILLEYGQPNTHKTPHIGHLFSYIFGESLARIIEYQGNKIIRANYQGDIGPHVAKCLYQVKKRGQEIKKLKTLKDKIDFLQKCYQEGSKLYEEDKKVRSEIDELNQKIYHRDPEILKLWQETRKWCLDFFKQFEQTLGIKYDKYYFESEIAARGKTIVEKFVGKIFEKSDQAIIFQGEKFGLHTRVFITKFGMPTYEAKDIALNELKKQLNFDLSIVTTASEQNEYYKVVTKASELIFPELEGKLKHLGFGLVHLKTGRMSSRTGEIVDAFSLVDLTQAEIKKQYKTDVSLAEAIALAAIKYSFLKSDAYKNIVFDWEKSIAKEGDSGPYLLYTYVRTQSILGKAPKFTLPTTVSNLNPEEKNILRSIYQFPEVIERAAKHYSPHLITTYLFQLAQSFNFFYQKHPVLKANKETKELRLALTYAVGKILEEGLYLLGIETVKKM